jgi:ABC-type multidrug transport system ATPase subunit
LLGRKIWFQCQDRVGWGELPHILSVGIVEQRGAGYTFSISANLNRAISMQLQIENLSKTYPGGVQALDRVSLTIPRGMFGLLGPNGAGKSTLMRTVATLQDADSGSVFLEGTPVSPRIDVLREKDTVRRLLGYLPQEFGVYPRTSAVRLLTHLAALKGVGANGRDRRLVVDQLLERVNLTDVRHKAVSTYSGGMRQRFGIAQALLGDPQLLIVDEPTAGLDPGERDRRLANRCDHRF